MAAESTHSDTPTNEKAEEQQIPEQQQKAKKGFFSKKAKVADVQLNEKSDDSTIESAPAAVKKDVPPASFASLFRCVLRRRHVACISHTHSPAGSPLNSSSSWMLLVWFVQQREAPHRYVVLLTIRSSRTHQAIPQPLMSLLFGRLTQDFVNFGMIVQQLNGPNGTEAQQQLPIAAAAFRRSAALDASYLVYIGRHIVIL